ncbi:MAG TPA: hypothetical protein VGR00_09025 [Thermoanaerobaculia bacterium]|jgi:hypothetical protein|nr:hypothetical protein [Thermoanaerobaculia bacterium]
MTSRHLTPESVTRWWSRTSSPAEFLETSDHIATCAACRALLSSRYEPHHVAGEVKHSLATVSPESFRPRFVAAVGLAAALAVFAVASWRLAQSSIPVVARAPLLRDGPLRVEADGAVTGVPIPWRTTIAALVREPALDPPPIVLALERGGEAQRSVEGSSRLVVVEGPRSRVVRESRPEFRWTGQPGRSFRVAVYGPKFELVGDSGPISANTWTPRDSLPRGQLLTWTVALDERGKTRAFPEPPDPPAVFLIIDEEAERSIAAARQTHSRLLEALTLWRAGLVGDSATAFAELARENPSSRLARRLADSAARVSATSH